ncbi:MAG TPA: hypothetical protein VFT22_17865, partial [Kofleriaceae bacterium]|nr:hypothetical protein [Kofleriaceae bacterium]
MARRGAPRRAMASTAGRRRSRIAIVLVAIALWWIAGRLRETSAITDPQPTEPGQARPPAAQRAASPGPSDPRARSPDRSSRIPYQRPVLADVSREVTVAGHVRDLFSRLPVGGVEVVFLSTAGEASTTTGDDGAYSIQLRTGMYRAFVRDDAVLSIGQGQAPRLPTRPSAEGAGVPDEALMAAVLATADVDGVDLTVVRGGVVSGKVVDREGRPIAGAAVRARGAVARPALATDVAETDRDGSFELRLP